MNDRRQWTDSLPVAQQQLGEGAASLQNRQLKPVVLTTMFGGRDAY